MLRARVEQVSLGRTKSQLVADNVQVSTSYLHLNVVHRSFLATMTLRKDVLQLRLFVSVYTYYPIISS